MYKLFNILNEIKILGNITIKMISNLYNELWNKNIDPNGVIWKYGHRYTDGSLEGWLKRKYPQNQKLLNNIYNDLLKLKEKGKNDDNFDLDNLDEIKLK